MSAASIFRDSAPDWHVDDKIVGYDEIGYFNVSKDDVKTYTDDDGRVHYNISGEYWVCYDRPKGDESDFQTMVKMPLDSGEYNWANYNSSGLYILVLVRDSDGNEIAWWYRVYARLSDDLAPSSNNSSALRASYTRVVSRGCLSVVYDDGEDVAFSIDGDWYSSRHPIGIVINAYNTTFEINGQVYYSATMTAICLNSTRYTFKLISPEEHEVKVMPYNEYFWLYEILPMVGIPIGVIVIGAIITISTSNRERKGRLGSGVQKAKETRIS